MSEQINVRVPIELKRKLQDAGMDYHEIARRAWEQAMGGEKDIKVLMEAEEEHFASWADSFIALYQFLNKKMDDRESLVMAEASKLEALWKRIQDRMKTREQLMEEVPELRTLTYEDCFDWQKIFNIIGKYPRTLQGKIGLVQIREFVLYREVKAGNFESVQAAREKLRADLDLRAEIAKKQLIEWTNSDEYRKQWLLKQEELTIAGVRKEAAQIRDVAKVVYDHEQTCPDKKEGNTI